MKLVIESITSSPKLQISNGYRKVFSWLIFAELLEQLFRFKDILVCEMIPVFDYDFIFIFAIHKLANVWVTQCNAQSYNELALFFSPASNLRL